MKVTLQVDGVEMTFTEEELIAILKEYFNQAKTEHQDHKPQSSQIHGPEEGVPFEVNPLEIDRKLFEITRKDPKQEKMRKTIQEALDEVKKNPDRYGKSFKTLMPVKTWNYRIVDELKELAAKLGDHMADWIEQALEWAQRIQNGESWKAICNEPDTANWYRLVEWKNGFYRLVGGSRKFVYRCPASSVNVNICDPNYELSGTVPLVVLYK